MVKIDVLIKEGKISKINELELERYINFFENSYKNNLEHCNFVIKFFPRCSIIKEVLKENGLRIIKIVSPEEI